MSGLVNFEVIGVFVNTLTADYKYPVRYCENLPFPNKMQLSKKRKTFCHFFVPLMESTWNFKHLKKKKVAIANAFRKLQTAKDLIRPLSKKHRFRTSFDSWHVKGMQTLVKSPWELFYNIFSLLWGEMIGKISPLLKFQIIGVFVNTLSRNYKYPVLDCENFTFPIQMQLS